MRPRRVRTPNAKTLHSLHFKTHALSPDSLELLELKIIEALECQISQYCFISWMSKWSCQAILLHICYRDASANLAHVSPNDFGYPHILIACGSGGGGGANTAVQLDMPFSRNRKNLRSFLQPIPSGFPSATMGKRWKPAYTRGAALSRQLNCQNGNLHIAIPSNN